MTPRKDMTPADKITHVLESIKTLWGYYTTIAVIIGGVSYFIASKTIKAAEQKKLTESVQVLTESVNNLTDQVQSLGITVSSQGEMQVIQISQMNTMQASWKTFLHDNKAVSKDFYAKLTDGLREITNEVKKNSLR